MSAEQERLALLLRQAAREYLGLAQGEQWDYGIAVAQARAILAAHPTPEPPETERGCVHGVKDGCLSRRCGSNCYSEFDRMHPCPACSTAPEADPTAGERCPGCRAKSHHPTDDACDGCPCFNEGFHEGVRRLDNLRREQRAVPATPDAGDASEGLSEWMRERLDVLLSEFYHSDDGDYVSAHGDIHEHVAARVADAEARLAEVKAERDELAAGIRQINKFRLEWYRKAGREEERGDRLEEWIDRLAGQSDDNLARAQRAEADLPDRLTTLGALATTDQEAHE